MAPSARLLDPGLMRRITASMLLIAGTGGWLLPFAATRVDAAATTNSVIMFEATQNFITGANNYDMRQGYTPSGASTACPSAIGNNWTCTWASDTFATGQSMAAGTATVNLYVQTSLSTITTDSTKWASATVSGASVSVSKPSGVVSGELMVAAIVTRAPTDTMTAPAGWTLRRFTRNTWLQMNVYTKTYAGEAGPYAFSWTTSTKGAGAILAFTNADTTNPIHNDWWANSGAGFTTARSAPGIMTSVPNTMVLALFGVAAGSTMAGTHPVITGMSEALDIAGGNGGTFTGIVADYALQAAVGATGIKGMTSTVSGGSVGATVALKPLTGTLTVQLLKNTTLIGSSTFTVGPGTALYPVSIPVTSTVSFSTGDRLNVKVIAPSTFNSQVWFGGSTQQSRLVTPTLGSPGAALQWSYATSAATMAAPGLDPWSNVVLAGSNDNNLYSMTASAGGLAFTNGLFPTGGAIQGRPALIPAAYRTPATVDIAYVSSQDGSVYAVDTATGQQVWSSPVLGTRVQAGPNVWLQYFKTLTICGFSNTMDAVIVATANASDTTTNSVYALGGGTALVTTGSPCSASTNAYQAGGGILWKYTPGNMDIVSSTPAVDYTNNAVWVTSRAGSSGNQPVLWKLNMATGALIANWTLASLGDTDTTSGIDSAPVLSWDGAWVYVGTNGTNTATLSAIPSNATVSNSGAITYTISSTTPAPCNCTGTGPIEGMPWPLSYTTVSPATPDTIIFTRNTTVHSVKFNGTTFTANWTATLTGTPTVSAPVDDSLGHLYIGASDGKVHQLDVATGTDQAQAPATAISGTMGDPTFNVDLNTILVGGSDGHIYSLQAPF